MRGPKQARRRTRWILIGLLLTVVAGIGTWYYLTRYRASAEPAEPALQTARVRVGDITITASGSGTLLPARELALGFRTSGVLAEVGVEVGDQVMAGDLLARLDDADAEAQVAQAKANLRLAELKLTELKGSADPVALAAAQSTLAGAQADLSRLLAPATEPELLAARENLASAQDALALLQSGPDPEKVAVAQASLTLAEINVRAAQAAFDKVAGRGDAGATKEAADLWQATTNYEKAKAEYQEAMTGPTSESIAAARAKVALADAQLQSLLAGPDPDAKAAAEAKLAQAQVQVEALLAGASAGDLEVAELGVAQAGYNLETALRRLSETELRAPMAGTVLTVQASAAEPVSASPIVTLADLTAPLVRFWVEETDLISVAPGNPVEILFEALPDLVFAGQVVRVDPALVTVDGTPAVQAWARIDLTSHPVTLLSGLTAEVVVVAGESEGALLVPVQALRETAPGQYAVFVVRPDGKLELRPVTIGLKDFANGEVLSGLEKGEVVSTGTVEVEGE
ncbi:MAG TPA: HlyD family efflux transporter periplasmic adaptor subunit [Anaerolineae bacterium]|nr:HlyD family efflux transporter periplasmic adaptor subunit [Anaerolineae bacterium]